MHIILVGGVGKVGRIIDHIPEKGVKVVKKYKIVSFLFPV